MTKLNLEDAIYALFLPLNERYAPTMELVRQIFMTYMFREETAPNTGTFIQSRFEGDVVGIADGPEIDFSERGLVGLRVMDLINKTDLRCFFAGTVEWFRDYPTEGTQRLQFAFNIINSLKEKIDAKAKRELTALGVPIETTESILPYLDSRDPVDVASGGASLILVSCLANAGNRALDIS